MRRFLTRIARIYRYLDCNDGAPLSFIFQLQLQLLELVVVERFVAQPPAPVAQPLAAATARAFAQSVAAAA
jgi:hypothetical protein